MATREELRTHEQSEFIARYLVEFGVRNIVLEHFCAGKSPQRRMGNFSDVTVVTPDEEIPWDKTSRLSDTEMRTIIRDVEKSLSLLCFVILLAEREGTLDQLVHLIQKRSFGTNGVGEDTLEETRKEWQALWKA